MIVSAMREGGRSLLRRFGKPRLLIVGALLFLSTATSLVSIFLWGIKEDWSTDERLHLGEGDTVDLWFTSQGDLIRLGQNGPRVTVDYWVAEKLDDRESGIEPLRRVFDIGEETGIPSAVPRLSWRNVEVAGAGDIVPYALSEDGSVLGWIWKDQLYLRRVRGSEPIEEKAISLEVSSIAAFCFSSQDNIAFLTDVKDGGVISSWSLTERTRSRWSIPISADSRLWSRGSLLAVSQFFSGDVLRADVSWSRVDAEVDRIAPESGTVLSISPDGSLIVGTEGGGVRSLGKRGSSIYLDLNRSIRAIGFLGDQVAVGGDFPGVRVLDNRGPSVQVLDGPSGVRVLAARMPYIAYANEETTDLARVREVCRLNEWGVLCLSIYSTFISLVAALHAFVIDKSSIVRA